MAALKALQEMITSSSTISPHKEPPKGIKIYVIQFLSPFVSFCKKVEHRSSFFFTFVSTFLKLIQQKNQLTFYLNFVTCNLTLAYAILCVPIEYRFKQLLTLTSI